MKREKLIRSRQIMCFSVSDMAKNVGISRNYYRQIEAGKRNPSLVTTFSILRVLDSADINIFKKI